MHRSFLVWIKASMACLVARGFAEAVSFISLIKVVDVVDDLVHNARTEYLLEPLVPSVVVVNLEVKLQAHLSLCLYLGRVDYPNELGDSVFALLQDEIFSDDTPIVVVAVLIVNAVHKAGVVVPGLVYYRDIGLYDFDL